MAHKAFIVGINTLGLRYCERDAQLMSTCLERYGYEIIQPEATKGDINGQFDELLDSCRKTDTVVLYFSGHGLVKKGKLFFILADDAAKSRHKINLNDLVDTFSDECKAKNKLIILDCCHGGAGIADWRPDLSDRFFILTASERLEKGKELDALEASFLTHRFQHALNQPPPEIVAADNTIRVSALYDWLVAEAQRHNSLPNAVQVPLPNLLGNHKANFALATHTNSTDELPQVISEEARRKLAAEKRYRELALESCDIIDLANLPEDRHVAARELELRRLYVPLRMRVDVRADDQIDEATFEALEKQRRPFLSERSGPKKANERVSVGKQLATARRLVVLGDPGAGKSTLLRWMATAYLLRLKEDPAWQNIPDVKTLPDKAWLPVLIRCRDLDPELCLYGSLHDMLGRTFRKNEMVVESDALQAVIEEKLKDGTALLLIDGLDEISNPSARIRLCQQIEQIERAYPKVPIIVTSRIVGYREMGSYRIKHSFEHLTITDFSKEDKDDFAHRWCAITERPERRAKATDELILAIHSNNRIERLTGNPMLLTTLALVKRKVGRLPTRRVDLYAEAVRVLLNWRSEVDEPLDYREAEPQLHYLAYAMCERGVQQLREDEIIDLLTTMRQEYPHLYAIKKRSPHEFLRLLERRTGILVEIGHIRHNGEAKPVFEFRHLTFQEYLAGLALVKGYFPNRDKSQSLADYVIPLASRTIKTRDRATVAADWREILRLCVAACNDDDVDNVLNAILSPLPHEYATTRPRAVLAASCLADEPNVSETMADSILQTFSHQVDERDGYGLSELRDAAMELASSRWEQKLRLSLVQAFCQKDILEQEFIVIYYGALINTIISYNKGTINTDKGIKATQILLCAVAQISTQNWKLPIKPTEVAKSFMSMLKANDATAHVAALGLAKLYERSHTAWQPVQAEREAMIALLNDPTIDTSVVKSLALILGQERDDQAVKPLIPYLNDSDDRVRTVIAKALGKIGVGDQQAIEALIACLDYPNKSLGKIIAEVLGKIGNAQTVEALIPYLNSPDRWLRITIVEILGEMGYVQAVKPLITCLDDPDQHVRITVVWALGEISNVQAVEHLIVRLDDPNKWLRRAIVLALGKIGSIQAVESLITCLDDSDESVRRAVTWVLEKINNAKIENLQRVEPLIACLGDPDERVRKTVVEVLGKIGDVQAVEPLISCLDDPEVSVRRAVVWALGKIGNVQAIEPLIARLDDPDKWVRITVALALGKIGDTRGISILKERLSDHDSQIRREALRGLVQTCQDEIDRKLLSEEINARYPFLDPQEVIGEPQLGRAALKLKLPMEEVKRRYEALAVRFGLRLGWEADIGG